MFDTEQSGQISGSTMRNILSNLGDKLQSDEIEVIINKMRETENKRDGDVVMNIDRFCHMILDQ